MVNVLSGILRGSMKERAWLNTHLLQGYVHVCLCDILDVFMRRVLAGSRHAESAAR